MKFVLLIDCTDKARQNPKSSQEFAAKMSESAKSIGAIIEHRYWGVYGDERKIKQALLNLLSNAVKFTSEGGRIEIKAIPVDGSVEISVANPGPERLKGQSEMTHFRLRESAA